MTSKFEDFKLIRIKNWTLNHGDGSAAGGFYQLNSEIYVIKEQDFDHTVNEYACSYIARLLIAENAPTVSLVKKANGAVYAASKFIPKFKAITSVFQQDLNLPRECFPYGCKLDQDGSVIIRDYRDNKDKPISPIIKGAEMVEVLIQLIGYSDAHDFNRGIINNSQAGLVDYGQCFKIYLDHTNYIKNFNKEDIIAALKKISSLKFHKIIPPLFKEIKSYYPVNLLYKIETIKQNALKTLHARQDSLMVDKNILLLEANPNNAAYYLNLIAPSFKKAGPEAKFIFCSLLKKNLSWNFKQDKCNNVRAPIEDQSDIAKAISYNDETEFKRILKYHLTPTSIAKLHDNSASLQKLQEGFQQMIIYRRDALLEFSLNELKQSFAATKFYPGFLSSLMVTAVTYDRGNIIEKIEQQLSGEIAAIDN